MKITILVLLMPFLPLLVPAQTGKVLKDIKYGNDERNSMDVWLAPSEKPAPIVIFMHGGGFTNGDKTRISQAEIRDFLKAGISVASINYRYRTNQPEGVLACLKDARRAVQFARYMSGEWNLDKSRVGMYGNSAGAGTSLWIAFHDEMADPGNPDPVMKESTRIQAAGANSTQCTYDLLRWKELLGFDAIGKELSDEKKMCDFYGISKPKQLNRKKGLQRRQELDFFSMITPDDPPFFLNCNVKGDIPPETNSQALHHPMHSKIILEKSQKTNLSVQAYIPAYGYTDQINVVEFFRKHLK